MQALHKPKFQAPYSFAAKQYLCFTLKAGFHYVQPSIRISKKDRRKFWKGLHVLFSMTSPNKISLQILLHKIIS
jgi:hypothetical protein